MKTSTYIEIFFKLYNYAVNLGMAPCFAEKRSKCYRFLAIIYLVVFTASFVYSYMTEDTKKTSFFLILYRLRSGTESLSIISYLLVTLNCRRHWKKLLEAVERFSETVEENVAKKSGSKLILGLWLLCHMVLIIVFAVECYFVAQGKIELKKWIIICYVRIHLYLKLITAIFVICTMKILAAFFEEVNKRLQNESGMLISTSSSELRIARHLREMETLHGTYCDIVEEFNTIFGWPVFFLLTYSSLVIVLDVNSILVLIARDAFRLQDEFGNITKMGLLMVFIVLIVVACDAVCTKANKISSSFFNLQRGLPKGYLKDEILKLVHCTTEEVPDVSAAGFFRISQSLLPVMISTITSYLIICIQINMYV